MEGKIFENKHIMFSELKEGHCGCITEVEAREIRLQKIIRNNEVLTDF